MVEQMQQPASDQHGSEGDASSQGNGNGVLGRLFGGGKKVTKAKMGLEMQMYYNEELKCWVMPGEEEEKRKQVESLKAPPIPQSAPSSTTSQTTGLGTLSTRYAAMPSMSISSGGGSGGPPQTSILTGLKPPPLGGAGFQGGQSMLQPFKPMSVFQPVSSVEGSESIGRGSEDGQKGDAKDVMMDPVALEILSFWSYYRGCGYDVDVMKEWVAENYGEDLCEQLDCDVLLADERIAEQVARYMDEHKQSDDQDELVQEYAENEVENTSSSPLYNGVYEERGYGTYADQQEHQEQQEVDDGYGTYAEQPQQQQEVDNGYGTYAEQQQQQLQDESTQHHNTYMYDSQVNAESYGEEGGCVTPPHVQSPDGPMEKDGEAEYYHARLETHTMEAPVFDDPPQVPGKLYGMNADHQETVENIAYTQNAVYESPPGVHEVPGIPEEDAHIAGATFVDNTEDCMLGYHPVPSGMINQAEYGGDDPHTAAAWGEMEELRMAHDRTTAALEEKTNELEEIRISMNSTIEAKDLEIANLKEEQTKVQEQLEALQNDLDEQRTTSKTEHDSMKEEMDQMMARIEELETESDALNAQISELEKDKEHHAMEESAHLTEAKEKIMELEAQIRELEEDMASKNVIVHENQELKSRVATIEEEAAQEIAAVTEEKEALEDAHAKAENDFQIMLDERDAEIMQLEARVMLSENAVQSAKDDVREEVEATMRATMAEERAELEAIVESKAAELTEMHQRVEEYEKKLALAKKKIQAQVQQIETLTHDSQEASNLRGQIQSLEQECAQFKLHIEDLEQKIQRAESIHVNEIENLTKENNQLMDVLGEKEDHMEMMNSELAQLRSTLESSTSLQEQIGYLEEQVAHLEEAASAAHDALMEEKEARDMAEAQCDEYHSRLQDAMQRLGESQEQIANLNQLSEEREEQQMATVQQLHATCEDYENRLQAASLTIENTQREIEELTRLLKEETDNNATMQNTEELESEISMLRHQMTSLSESASNKEDELRRYKLQLVKAKKLRASDQERIEELQDIQEAYQSTIAEHKALQEHMVTMREELQQAQETAQLADESLNDALAALGHEEAKVIRLSELLEMAGLTKDEIQAELEAVDMQVGYDDNDDDVL